MPPSPIFPWQGTHNPEYRTAKGWRIVMIILAPPLALLFLALPFLMAQKASSAALTAGIGVVSFGMAGVMIYGLLETVKGVFIIGPREISQVGAFKTKTLALNEILGFRVDDKYANIYPKESYLPTIKVANTVRPRRGLRL